MIKKILMLMIWSLLTPAAVFAVDGVYVFSKDKTESKLKEVGLESFSEPFLEDHFSNTSDFNYFEKNALSSHQSVFLYGLDQRFLDLQYNGFSLRDPSHPTGIFNVSALSALIGNKKLISGGSGSLSLDSEPVESGFLEAEGTSLGEAKLGVQQNLCELKMCYSAGAVLEKGGGFSQSTDGLEKDYFHKMHLNFNKTTFHENVEDKTFLFYSGQIFDEDSVGAFAGTDPESLSAKSKGASLFIGKSYKFLGIDPHLEVRGAYLKTYRAQEDIENAMKFSQESDVFELHILRKGFELKVFKEAYDLFSFADEDYGVSLSYEKSYEKFGAKQILKTEIGYTEKRDVSGRLDYRYKYLNAFFKATTPSLFQASYNDKFVTGVVDKLKTQNLIGLHLNHGWRLNSKTSVQAKAGYSRIFDFIDFDLLNNSYQNLDEIEILFVKFELKRSIFSFFIQNQLARNISSKEAVKEDLARRPDWTLGLKAFKKFGYFNLGSDLRWVSSRKAFDGSPLDPFWDTSIKLGYKSFRLEASNLFDQREEVFRGLERRPITFALKYRKTF